MNLARGLAGAHEWHVPTCNILAQTSARSNLVRVSGDDTKKGNLAGQLEMCREYAQSKGYTIVAELAKDDRGAKGADFDLPEINRGL